MNLEDLGYNETLKKLMVDQHLEGFEIGRVIAEHRERYLVHTGECVYEAEITGNMRYTAETREDFPAVGDWVTLTTYESEFAVIHNILPRFSIIKRQAVGQFGEIQIIATNIDNAFLVVAADRDFNINRLERYLTICNSSKVNPLIVLTKIDLIQNKVVTEMLEKIKARIKHIPILPISNITQEGYETIKKQMKKGRTYCLLGSSGVGKSTLLNHLSGRSVMKTDSISQTTNKGKHITVHRELIVLENGGILIDNPGMREVGIADSTNGLEITFDKIVMASHNCKYKNCTHTVERGCSVIEAVDKGDIDKESYENYLKMQKEKAYFESTVEERHKKEKEFGKMLKNYKKDLKNNTI